MIKLLIWAIRPENSTSSFEQLFVAAIKLKVFPKFSHWLNLFSQNATKNSRIFASFIFAKCDRKSSPFFAWRFVRWKPYGGGTHDPWEGLWMIKILKISLQLNWIFIIFWKSTNLFLLFYKFTKRRFSQLK